MEDGGKIPLAQNRCFQEMGLMFITSVFHRHAEMLKEWCSLKLIHTPLSSDMKWRKKDVLFFFPREEKRI